MQHCIMVHSWGNGGSVESTGSGHQRLMLHSQGAAVVKSLFYVNSEASPVAAPFNDHQQNAGVGAL